jgi:hypothetical protein
MGRRWLQGDGDNVGWVYLDIYACSHCVSNMLYKKEKPLPEREASWLKESIMW